MKIALAVIIVCLMACTSSVRRIQVDGESCEKVRVIYDSDRKKVKGPAG